MNELYNLLGKFEEACSEYDYVKDFSEADAKELYRKVDRAREDIIEYVEMLGIEHQEIVDEKDSQIYDLKEYITRISEGE